jgi:hypothetical protein
MFGGFKAFACPPGVGDRNLPIRQSRSAKEN